MISNSIIKKPDNKVERRWSLVLSQGIPDILLCANLLSALDLDLFSTNIYLFFLFQNCKYVPTSMIFM